MIKRTWWYRCLFELIVNECRLFTWAAFPTKHFYIPKYFEGIHFLICFHDIIYNLCINHLCNIKNEEFITFIR